MKKIAIALLLTASIVTPAIAADMQHMYVGARVGKAKTSIDNQPLNKDNPTGYGVFIGHMFSPSFALQGEYLRLGEVTLGIGGGNKSEGYSLSGVGFIPLGGEDFSLFGKLGYAKIESKPTGSSPGVTSKSDGVTYGFGGQFNVTPMVGIRAGWDKYKLDDSAFKGDISLVSVGAVFKF